MNNTCSINTIFNHHPDQAQKNAERARMYSTTRAAAGISYKLTDFPLEKDFFGSNRLRLVHKCLAVAGLCTGEQLPVTGVLACPPASCSSLLWVPFYNICQHLLENFSTTTTDIINMCSFTLPKPLNPKSSRSKCPITTGIPR